MSISQSSDGGQAPARIDDAARRASALLDQSQNRFRKLWEAGYRSLVSICPPDATISERSTLFKRVGSHQDPRGKAPGRRWSDGTWSSFDWRSYQCVEEDLDRWFRMGAGIGIKTGQQADGTWLVGIDADTLNERHAAIISGKVRSAFGLVPTRVGRAPKALYVLRLDSALPYCRVEFDGEGGTRERVEILSEGQQFVAWGEHPVTHKPYDWTQKLLVLDELRVFKPAEVLHLLSELKTLLPNATDVHRSGGEATVDQASLRGEPAAVARVVHALPNTSEIFPERMDYVGVGYAIKASLGDVPEAWDLYWSWCDRWPGDEKGANDFDRTREEWDRMKPPYRRGFRWLADLAHKHSDGAFNIAELWYEEQRDSLFPQPCEVSAPPNAGSWPEPLDLFANADPGELAEPPAGSLPKIIENWAWDEARRKGVTPAFAAMAALGVCASAVGAALKIQVYEHDDGWLEPASLWVTLVAPPGTGKSPVINAALAPLKAVDAERFRDWRPKHDAWARFQKTKGKKAEDAPIMPEPILARSIVDNVTFERQVRIHAENPRGILRVTDELAGLLGSLGAYKRGAEGDRAEILRVFDGAELLQDRVGTGMTRAEHALMGIVVGTQPDKIRTLARDLGTDGLLQRMIFILHDGTSRHGIDEPADRRAAGAYAEAVRYLASMDHGRGAKVRMTTEAQALVREARENIAGLHDLTSVSAACRGHLEKWGKLLPRIALTFHCLDMFDALEFIEPSAAVEAGTMRRAIAFSRFLLRHSLRFHEEYGTASDDVSEARWIAGHILTKPGLQSVDRRDLYSARKALQGPANLPVLLAAMRELENAGWCRAVLSSRDASGPRIWEINPEIHTRFDGQGAREIRERREKQAKIRAAGALRANWVDGK